MGATLLGERRVRTVTVIPDDLGLAANKIDSIYRDGNGHLFGNEGPVYYVMGRMCDDPEKNSALQLLPEYYEAAYGKAAAPMAASANATSGALKM